MAQSDIINGLGSVIDNRFKDRFGIGAPQYLPRHSRPQARTHKATAIPKNAK